MVADNWLKRAQEIFSGPRPQHFTNHTHCCECAEHDETLRNSDVDSIGLDELGNPGWDPLCFCSAEGLLYYAPAMIRLSLETVDGDFYFSQLLFHLDYEGTQNRFLNACSPAQRRFIGDFVSYMILTYPQQLDDCYDQDIALRVAEYWSDCGDCSSDGGDDGERERAKVKE